MSTSPWAPYLPDAADALEPAAGRPLHRRAGFAATWAELQRDLKDGPERPSTGCWRASPASTASPRTSPRTPTSWPTRPRLRPTPRRLKAWWVYRMLFGPTRWASGSR